MAESQGSRIITCAKHGVPYDAAIRGGCRRCIQEWEHPRPAAGRATGFPTSIKLLGLVLVVAGFYVFLNRPRPAEEAAPATAPAQPAAPRAEAGEEESAEALRQRVRELSEVIRSGREEVEVQLAGESDPEVLKESWDFWCFGWNNRIERLAARQPREPGSQDPLLARVAVEVERSIAELRAVAQATNGGVPDAGLVAQRFVSAEIALKQARLHLARFDR